MASLADSRPCGARSRRLVFKVVPISRFVEFPFGPGLWRVPPLPLRRHCDAARAARPAISSVAVSRPEKSPAEAGRDLTGLPGRFAGPDFHASALLVIERVLDSSTFPRASRERRAGMLTARQKFSFRTGRNAQKTPRPLSRGLLRATGEGRRAAVGRRSAQGIKALPR